MTLKNNRAPLLCYFVHHFIAITESRLELQFRNAQFGPKLAMLLSLVTLKFNAWPWKSIGHLFYATSSFVLYLIAIGGFKLELQFGNDQIGAKFVLTSVTLTFDLWPWPFAWISLLSMITIPENFMMIPWEEHSEKCVREGQADGRKDGRTVVFLELLLCSVCWPACATLLQSVIIEWFGKLLKR